MAHLKKTRFAVIDHVEVGNRILLFSSPSPRQGSGNQDRASRGTGLVEREPRHRRNGRHQGLGLDCCFFSSYIAQLEGCPISIGLYGDLTPLS